MRRARLQCREGAPRIAATCHFSDLLNGDSSLLSRRESHATRDLEGTQLRGKAKSGWIQGNIIPLTISISHLCPPEMRSTHPASDRHIFFIKNYNRKHYISTITKLLLTAVTRSAFAEEQPNVCIMCKDLALFRIFSYWTTGLIFTISNLLKGGQKSHPGFWRQLLGVCLLLRNTCYNKDTTNVEQ